MSDTPQIIGIAVVESGGCYLVGRRDGDGPLAGFDEFPGGKCKAAESPAACAVRECEEEAGLIVEAVELLMRQPFSYDHGDVDLHFYLCRPADQGQRNHAPDGYRWVTAGELSQLKFPPANQPLLGRLIAERREEREEK